MFNKITRGVLYIKKEITKDVLFLVGSILAFICMSDIFTTIKWPALILIVFDKMKRLGEKR